MAAILTGLARVFARVLPRVAPRIAARAGPSILRAPLRAGKNIVTRPTILQQAGTATSRATVGLRHHHPVYIGRLATQARPVLRPLVRHVGVVKASRLSRVTSPRHRAVLSRALARRTARSVSRPVKAPEVRRSWLSRHKGTLALTAASIGIPIGAPAAMQAAAEAKSDKFNNEYLKLMKSQNDALHLQQPMMLPPSHNVQSAAPVDASGYYPMYQHPSVIQAPMPPGGVGYQYPYYDNIPAQQYGRQVALPPYVYNPFDQMYGSNGQQDVLDEEEEMLPEDNKQSGKRRKKGKSKKKKSG